MRRLIATAAAALAAAAFALVVLLGWAPASPGQGAEPSRTAESSPPSTARSYAPGPVVLSAADAGERYLAITCGVDATIATMNAAMLDGLDEYRKGGSPDPTFVNAAAGLAAAHQRKMLELLLDDYYVWPEGVYEQLNHVRLGLVAGVAEAEGIADAVSFDQAYNVERAAPTREQREAPAEIRRLLGLPADARSACAGLGAADTDRLIAEQRARRISLGE